MFRGAVSKQCFPKASHRQRGTEDTGGEYNWGKYPKCDKTENVKSGDTHFLVLLEKAVKKQIHAYYGLNWIMGVHCLPFAPTKKGWQTPAFESTNNYRLLIARAV